MANLVLIACEPSKPVSTLAPSAVLLVLYVGQPVVAQLRRSCFERSLQLWVFQVPSTPADSNPQQALIAGTHNKRTSDGHVQTADLLRKEENVRVWLFERPAGIGEWLSLEIACLVQSTHLKLVLLLCQRSLLWNMYLRCSTNRQSGAGARGA